jgi:UDP-N-acetylmuramoylalanine--D-glutamate ligase
VSPGVPQNSDIIVQALANRKEVFSEIEIASWFCKGKIIAITGTNGKTTTTTLTGEIFKDAGFNTYVCGNIGLAFSEVADEIPGDAVVIIETSSFQLDNIKHFNPLIAIILNITPDHLDRYEHSFQKYAESKMRITENQNDKENLVYNYDDKPLVKMLKNSGGIKARKHAFSLNSSVSEAVKSGAYLNGENLTYFYSEGVEDIIESDKLKIKGPHNIYNSLASIIPAKIFDINTESINKTLSSFNGVEHRLEFVRDINGIKFFNDSKATNVNSVWYALQGFGESPIILILGGKDKGNDYSEIKELVLKHVKEVIAIGESKEKVFNFFSGFVRTTKKMTLEDAICSGAADARKGDIVLLSPACASFDMFDNYEHRGREFKRIVNAL